MPHRRVLTAGEFPKGIKFKYIPYSEEKSDIAACGIPIDYNTDKEFPRKKVVIVAAPGAFTPACTENHIPPFIQKAKELKAKGVDDIIVLATNDPFVQAAWSKALGDKGNLIFASDGNAEFSKSIGFCLGQTPFGVRTSRYAIVVDHGKVTYAEQEPGRQVTVSGVDAVLAKL
jgi:alkyl hydroperoxide reductase 1